MIDVARRPPVFAIAFLFVLVSAAAAAAADVGPGADAARGDAFRFAADAGEQHTIALERTATGARFSWPRAASAWNTALLRVPVQAGTSDPWITISSGQVQIKQHQDSGADGWRWLNLTALRPVATERAPVDLQLAGLQLGPGTATLRLFGHRVNLNGRILILAPHPDDAEIAAFGLYADRDATIVTVTSGNAGDANYRAQFPDDAEQYRFKGYLRAVDSVTVPWQGGIPPERCFNLGYFDARLAAMRDTPNQAVAEMYGPNTDVAVYRRANIGRLLPVAPRANRWSNLVDDLVAVLKKVRPTTIVMPHPLLDSHTDHQLVAVAAVEALARWNQPATFLLYTNHAFRNLYPFGPAGTEQSIPPWFEPIVPVQGLYAHPVSAELQRRKLFALESMHDLRLSPVEQSGCASPAPPVRRSDYPRVTAVDYLRRAPRPHEIFWVHDRKGVTALIAEFMAANPARPAR